MRTFYPKEICDFIGVGVEGHTNSELAEMVNARFGTNFTPQQMKDYKNYRHLSSNARSARANYPREVEKYIQKHYRGTPPKEMAERINKKFGSNYSADQMRKYYEKCGYKSGCRARIFEGAVRSFILENCAEIGPKRMAELVNDKFDTSITAEQMRGIYDNHGLVSHAPHGGRDVLPVGHERRISDGSVLVKMSGAGDNTVYARKHRMIWEHAHGPIPDDSYLIFLDGDKTNCELENLRLVTKQEFFTLMHQDLLTDSPAANESAILIARIRATIKNRAKAARETHHRGRQEHGE